MVITICGSLKFKDVMLDVYDQLTELGNIVLLPAINGKDHNPDWYLQLHFDKIRKSDAIYVIDVDNYTGSSTHKEISFAASKCKQIFFYSDHDLFIG